MLQPPFAITEQNNNELHDYAMIMATISWERKVRDCVL
jgi:hypothetical protein